MKNKKILFVSIGGLALIIVTLLIISVLKNENKVQEDYKPIYLTLEDITNIEGCYDFTGNNVSCQNDDDVYTMKYKEKTHIQKVLVDLNGTDKAIFTILKGDIEQNEDLLLIYDGLYTLSENESYYTYKTNIRRFLIIIFCSMKIIDKESRYNKCEGTIIKYDNYFSF